MGMDVYGLQPRSRVGEYFRASIWEWPTVLEAISATGVLPQERVDALSFNDGARVSAEEAERLADALAGLMEVDPVPARPVESISHLVQLADQVLYQLVREMPKGEVIVSKSDDETLLKRFIEFLRNCGGFEVW